MRSLIIQSTAGRMAERRLLGGRRTPHNFWPEAPRSDSGDAAACARLLGVHGRRIRPFVAKLAREADAIIERRWLEVVAVATHLEASWARRRIGRKDIDRIIAEARAAGAPVEGPAVRAASGLLLLQRHVVDPSCDVPLGTLSDPNAYGTMKMVRFKLSSVRDVPALRPPDRRRLDAVVRQQHVRQDGCFRRDESRNGGAHGR